jgi:dTDP-4-amino-4,6-dideoxygalactose transaminase
MRKVIPYGRQSITKEDIEAVVETLAADFLTQGPKVKEFEDKFALYTGVKYAVAVNNATSGLHLSVLALGLKKGERVITTPITFASTANCVRFCGGEVWFADIDPHTYLLDLESVRELIESKPKGFFKGIIPVDFAGLPVNLEKFRILADKHNLWLVEDACHAPGGHFTNSKNEIQKCGNGNYADIAVFSFHPVKHIACGEGGMITTNSKELYKKLLSLRTHGISKEGMSKNDGGWYYEIKELGYNYRLTDIQSALGITQLEKNKEGVKRRNENLKNV